MRRATPRRWTDGSLPTRAGATVEPPGNATEGRDTSRDGRGRTGQSGPSRQDRCTSTPRDPRPSRDDQGCQGGLHVVVRARGRSRRPARSRGARSTCGTRPSRPLRSLGLSVRAGASSACATASHLAGRPLARSRGCVRPIPAAPPRTAWRPARRADFAVPAVIRPPVAPDSGAGWCIGLSLPWVDPRQPDVAISRSIGRRTGCNLHELPTFPSR